MPSPLQIGQTVRIKDLRNGAIFGAEVTEEKDGRFFVTKTNKADGNRMCPTHEPLPHLLRFDDGTPCQDGEQYVIIEIVGAPTDLAQSMKDTILENTRLKEEIKALRVDMLRRDEVVNKRLAAVVKTLADSLEDVELARALTESLQAAVSIQMPTIQEPAPAPKPKAPAKA